MRLLGKEAIVPEMEPSTDAVAAVVQVDRETTSGAFSILLLLVLELLIKADTEADGKGDEELMVDMLDLFLMDDGF